MPELQKNPAAGFADGVCNQPPSFGLSLCVDSRRVKISMASRRHRRGLGNDQTGAGALAVILRIQLPGDVARHFCAHPCQRRHDNAVREAEFSQLNGVKQGCAAHKMSAYAQRSPGADRTLSRSPCSPAGARAGRRWTRGQRSRAGAEGHCRSVHRTPGIGCAAGNHSAALPKIVNSMIPSGVARGQLIIVSRTKLHVVGEISSKIVLRTTVFVLWSSTVVNVLRSVETSILY